MSSPTLKFDGNSDYVDCGDKPEFEPNQITVSVWAKPQQLNNFSRIYGKANNGSMPEGYRLMGSKNGNFLIWNWVSNSGSARRITTQDHPNEWNHYTWTHDGSVGKGYVNGELVGQDNSGFASQSNHSLYIGSGGVGSYFYEGELDDIRIFNTALTQDEIKKVMNGFIIGSETALWSMNEGKGNTITDATTNNNSGDIHGATWSSRPKGYTLSWGTVQDWDNSIRQDDIEHEQDGGVGVGESSLQIGQPFDQLTDNPNEAYYKVISPHAILDTVEDVSPANNDGTLHGVQKVTEPNTKFTSSMYFNGSSDYAEIPTSVFSQGNILSFESWVYPRQYGIQSIVNLESIFRVMWDDHNPHGFCVITQDGESTRKRGPSNLPVNDWHHVNVYWNIGTEIGICVNGDTWYTLQTTDTPNNRNGPYTIGKTNANSYYFDGKMTEMRFVTGQRINTDESLYQTDGELKTGYKK